MASGITLRDATCISTEQGILLQTPYAYIVKSMITKLRRLAPVTVTPAELLAALSAGFVWLGDGKGIGVIFQTDPFSLDIYQNLFGSGSTSPLPPPPPPDIANYI